MWHSRCSAEKGGAEPGLPQGDPAPPSSLPEGQGSGLCFHSNLDVPLSEQGASNVVLLRSRCESCLFPLQGLRPAPGPQPWALRLLGCQPPTLPAFLPERSHHHLDLELDRAWFQGRPLGFTWPGWKASPGWPPPAPAPGALPRPACLPAQGSASPNQQGEATPPTFGPARLAPPG